MSGIKRTVEELKRGKFTSSDSGCHIWHGATIRSSRGNVTFVYGKVWDGYTYKGAHRAVMESHLGRKLSKEEFVCHKCDTPLCVNVDHLFVGSNLDNIKDMYTKKRGKGQMATHCKRGHEYAGENLYICSKGNRRCRACVKIVNTQARSRYWSRNAEKLRAKNREYHKLNKEKIRDRKKKRKKCSLK